LLSAVYLIFVVVMFAICGVALAKGDRPAQVAAVAYLVGWLASVAVRGAWIHNGVNVGGAIIDTLLLLVLSVLAWRYDRAWVVFACALEAIHVTVHVCYGLNVSIGAGAYLAAQQLATHGVLIAIAIGAGQAWLERAMTKAPHKSDVAIGS
jgi:hypothetical protein